MYQDGRTFSSAVSHETVTLVEQKLKNTPLALDLIQPMKPWMVMLMIEALGSQARASIPSSASTNTSTTWHRQPEAGHWSRDAESQIDRFDKMPEADAGADAAQRAGRKWIPGEIKGLRSRL